MQSQVAMVSNVLQVVGFVLGIISWGGMIGTCAAPEWRKSAQGQTIIDSTLKYEGLWVRCKSFSTGQTQCHPYNAFFIGLNGVLQVCRALIITSISLGFIAIIITIFGLKCVHAGSASTRVKAILALVGGLLFGVAGLGTAITVYFAFLWATNEGYEVMNGFYIAVGTSVAAMLASMLLVFASCASCKSKENVEKQAKSRTYSFRGRPWNNKLAMREERRADFQRCAIFSSILPLFATEAILTGAAVSYFAHGVVQEYYNPALTKDMPLFLRFQYGYGLFIGWGSLVVGILSSALICSASVAILVRRILVERSNPQLHELRPVPILQNSNTIEPVSVQVHKASTSLHRDYSNRQVRIQDPNSSHDGTRTHNGGAATRSSSTLSIGRRSQNSDRRGRRPRQERSQQGHRNAPEDAHDRYSSARAKRRRSYDESLERVRTVSGQIKQYV